MVWVQRPRVENRNRRNIKQRSTSQKWASLQLRPPLSLGWRRISGQEFWSMWVCVWGSIQPCGRRAWRFGKYWTCLHQQRKCLHLVFITMYCTHTHTHRLTAIISYLFSFCVCSARSTGAHHNMLLLNLFSVPSTNTDLKEQDFYNWYNLVNGLRTTAKLISLFHQE